MREAVARPKRHPRQALTTRQIDALKANDRTRRIADGNGLYVVVAANGSKHWILRTVVKGKRCDIGLGSYSLVKLSDARDEASKLRRIARNGGDPLALRRLERRPIPTFRSAAEQVHASLLKGFKNQKHRAQWISSLSGVFTAFGSKQVDAISTADILAALNPDWLKKPETSRRVLQRVRAVFDWCIAQGHRIGGNPTIGVTKVLPQHRTRPKHFKALPYAQVPSFITGLRTSNATQTVKSAFEFLILTGARTSQTLFATWDEIDFQSRTWSIPAERMKIPVDHRVPLSDRCIEILNDTRKVSAGHAYIFPGRRRDQPLSTGTFDRTLERMKCAATTHGFRSAFRDWAAEQTPFARVICEAALAHSLGDKTETAYLRSDFFEQRRPLMAAWADFVAPDPTEQKV